MGASAVRRALLRHALLSLTAVVVVSALVVVGAWRFAGQDARRRAVQSAGQVAAAVLQPLSRQDLERPAGVDRDALRERLAPFLEAGIVQRVKVFAVRGDTATVVYSDEPRNEGNSGYLAPALAARLDAGGTVVQPVPADVEHRYENPLAGSRLEVFFGFRDAAGRTARLELYVPVDRAAAVRHTVGDVLPLVLSGLGVVAFALMPMTTRLTRRMVRERAEQRAARDYGLSAAERTRHDLARLVHDDVLPDLAAVRLLLETARDGHHGALERAHTLLTGEIGQLRTLLDDLLPPEPFDLAHLVAWVRHVEAAGAGPAVELDVRAPVGAMLYRAAGELLRNAFRHAGATTVRVGVTRDGEATVLTVADDGAGFDPGAAPPDGHVGLRLVERAARDEGGTMTVDSAPGAGCTVTVVV